MVGEARDGPGAVLKASQLQPDIIILDIGLPGINGIEAAKLIRKNCPDADIIFLTQQTDSEVIKAAFEAGGAAYVVKARAVTDLLLAINTTLQAAPEAAPSEARKPPGSVSRSNWGFDKVNRASPQSRQIET